MPEPRTKTKRAAAKLPTSETETTTRVDVANGDDGTVPHEEIARRAYEIAQGDDGGSDEQNWLRAERELRRRSATRG